MINKKMKRKVLKLNFWPGTEYYSVRLMSSSRENLECWLDESLVIADWTDSSIRRQNNPIPIEPTQIERTQREHKRELLNEREIIEHFFLPNILPNIFVNLPNGSNLEHSKVNDSLHRDESYSVSRVVHEMPVLTCANFDTKIDVRTYSYRHQLTNKNNANIGVPH